MAWTNAPARVYHGTSLAAAYSIIARAVSTGTNGIELTRCRADADFGKGFYVTTVLHQAQQWANCKVRSAVAPRALLTITPADTAAVLSFDLDRDVASGGDTLTFVVEDGTSHDFVLYNRLRHSAHARGGGTPYDVVYGPVAAFPQSVTYSDCDQICFLTDRALAALGPQLPNPAPGSPLFL